ncbi:MAG: hypothetical protein PHP69_02170 [Candidatus Omnitrophica bacterium]|nr:hypothetical protein [Candidatus Omnitrophota bacterium]MDD5440937.1 hypothetical protein [Candidatus Omnitrophota bacterium]
MCSKKQNKKRIWAVLEITKIKLNPEQAVLSCCAVPSRGATEPPFQCSISGSGSGVCTTQEAYLSNS